MRADRELRPDPYRIRPWFGDVLPEPSLYNTATVNIARPARSRQRVRAHRPLPQTARRSRRSASAADGAPSRRVHRQPVHVVIAVPREHRPQLRQDPVHRPRGQASRQKRLEEPVDVAARDLVEALLSEDGYEIRVDAPAATVRRCRPGPLGERAVAVGSPVGTRDVSPDTHRRREPPAQPSPNHGPGRNRTSARGFEVHRSIH